MWKIHNFQHSKQNIQADQNIFVGSTIHKRHIHLYTTTPKCNNVISLLLFYPGVALGIFRRGLTRPTRGAKIWFSGYYKCQKYSKKSLVTFQRGLACSDGGYSPL